MDDREQKTATRGRMAIFGALMSLQLLPPSFGSLECPVEEVG